MFKLNTSPSLHFYFTLDEEMVMYDDILLKTSLFNSEVCSVFKAIMNSESIDNLELEKETQESINILLEHHLIEDVA